MNRGKFFTLAVLEGNRFLSNVCSGWGSWAVLQDKVIILTHLFSIYGSFAGLSSPVVLSKESDQVTEGIIPFT